MLVFVQDIKFMWIEWKALESHNDVGNCFNLCPTNELNVNYINQSYKHKVLGLWMI